MADSRAIICTAIGKVEIQSVPKPKLRPGSALIKTKAVALNPTDWKSIYYDPQGSAVGNRLGVDFAGIIDEVGPNAAKNFKKGDRVCGSVFGGRDAETGAFADYLQAIEHLLFKIPDHLSFEQAATLGVGMTTCGQALYQLLSLPLPPAAAAHPQQTILIGGGSTATAVLGIQYAKLSGLCVIATASPYNFDFLRSLGVDVLLDYHESTDDLVKKIREATGGSLTLAWDCSPNDKFHQVAALSMSSTKQGTYATVNPLTPVDFLKDTNPMVESKYQLAYTVFGEEFTFASHTFPASQEDEKFGEAFWEKSANLLEEKKLQPTRVTVNKGGKGLEGIVAGLEELYRGNVAGKKLVYAL